MPRNNAEITESTNSHYTSELPSPPFKFTLEIPLFLLMVGISLSGAVINNMLLFRTCVHSLNYTEEQCNLLHEAGDKTNDTKYIEEETQQYTSIVTMVRSILEAVCPAILSLFLGVWSDTYGRKPLVVWPLLGMSFTSMLVVGYSLMKNLGPWWYILTAIPVSLSGGLSALFTGAFSYISDITSHDTRSFRLSLLEAAVFLGTILGSLSSSYIVQWAGSEVLLLIHSTVYVAAYAFTNVYVAESLRGALKGGLCTVLDFLLVKEMVTTCFKRRANKLRAIILLIVFANSLSIFILYGLYNLDYLYTREKLLWDLKNYTIYSASNTVIMVVGLFIGVTFVQKVCRVSDVLLASISYLSSLAEVVVKAVAVTSWHMYLGASISMFRGLAAPLSRSLLTKILPLEDIAKVFALTCALEAILPVFSPIVFNTLYSHSLIIYPGAIYVLSGVIYGCCFIMLGFVQFYLWRYPSSPYAPLNT